MRVYVEEHVQTTGRMLSPMHKAQSGNTEVGARPEVSHFPPDLTGGPGSSRVRTAALKPEAGAPRVSHGPLHIYLGDVLE